MRDNQENIVEAEPKSKPPRKIARIMLMILGSIIVISVLMCRQELENNRISRRATAEADWLLSEAHGEEVYEAIKKFESNWNTLETRRDRSIRSEFVTSSFLNYVDNFSRLPTPENGVICNYPECLVRNSAVVTAVRVIEYSPERFKAIGCRTSYLEYVSPEGEFIRSQKPLDASILYIFVYVEDIWKLQGLYNVTIPDDAYRDWEYLPESYQKIIGPLPSSLSCETRPPD